MKLHSVFTKTVYDRRHGLLWWSLGIGLLTVVVLSVWPSVRDEYQTLVKDYPEALLAFFGIDKAGVGSAEGYLQAELFGFMVPLMLIAYMIAGGSAATAGERERERSSCCSPSRSPRGRVLVHKYLALCALLAVISMVYTVVLIAVSQRFPPSRAGVGSCRRHADGVRPGCPVRRGRSAGGLSFRSWALAAGVASGAALAAYLLTSIAALVAGLKPFRPLSPFWWYSGNDPLRHGLDVLHVAAPPWARRWSVSPVRSSPSSDGTSPNAHTGRTTGFPGHGTWRLAISGDVCLYWRCLLCGEVNGGRREGPARYEQRPCGNA